MSDIMELIRDYGASWQDRTYAQNNKAYNKIKSHISAMQEVCDAVDNYVHNNITYLDLYSEYCVYKEDIDKLNEVCK
jgi:hypothetical protein